MTQRSKRMGTVLWLAAQSERAAAERLISSRRELNELSGKLAQLQAGRAEYMTRLESGASMGASQMRELRRFVEKLDVAIAQLQQQVRHKEQVSTQHQEQWHGQRKRKEAIGNIAERYQRAEERAAESKLQFEIDDRRVTRDSDW